MGFAYYLYGLITSPSNLTSVTVGAYYRNGNPTTELQTVYPNSKTYEVHDIDNKIWFPNLKAGYYTYKVIAKNATETKTLISSDFTVGAPPALVAGYYVSYNPNGGEYSYKTQATRAVDDFDNGRGTDKLVVFRYGSTLTTGTNTYGCEAVVDSNNRVIKRDANNNAIPTRGFVISGHGTAMTWVENNIIIGNYVFLDIANKKIVVFADQAQYIGYAKQQQKLNSTTLNLANAIPTRSGYTFKGWSKSQSGSIAYQPGSAYTENASCTLYAQWDAMQSVATPTISSTQTPNGVSVTLSCATAGATIYYTTNGSTPTTSSTAYNGAFLLTSSATVKAIAVKSGMNNSAVASR